MDQYTNTPLPDNDLTLASDRHGAWTIAALESNMAYVDIAAVSAVRMRLLGAVEIASEVMGDGPPPELVTETLRQIHDVARSPTYPV